MGVLPPQHPVTGTALLPSLLTPWTTSSTRKHQSNPRLQSNRRSFLQPSIQSRRQEPLMRRRRPPMVLSRKPPMVVRRKPTKKPKSGWNSWINISWGPKTPIWPLTLLHPQQVVCLFQEQVFMCLMHKMPKRSQLLNRCKTNVFDDENEN